MRYAITGATGFVGGALARQLVEAGHAVRALARSPERATALTALGADIVPGDLSDSAALDSLCGGVDGLFHVAGWYKLGSRTPDEGRRINVDGTRAALAAARRAGLRVVYTSTLAVNSDTQGRVVDEDYHFTGTHLSVYDQTKAQAHEIALGEASRGLEIIIVQPGLVYGPGDTSQTGELIAAVVAGARPLVPDAGGTCWGYIDDIATGHALAMDRGQAGRSYLLAGPPATLAAGLRIAADIAGTAGPRTMPSRAVRAGARVVHAVERIIPVPAGYASETMRSSLATYWGDASRAEAELGWRARGIREGMSETVAALRA